MKIKNTKIRFGVKQYSISMKVYNYGIKKVGGYPVISREDYLRIQNIKEQKLIKEIDKAIKKEKMKQKILSIFRNVV